MLVKQCGYKKGKGSIVMHTRIRTKNGIQSRNKYMQKYIFNYIVNFKNNVQCDYIFFIEYKKTVASRKVLTYCNKKKNYIGKQKIFFV